MNFLFSLKTSLLLEFAIYFQELCWSEHAAQWCFSCFCLAFLMVRWQPTPVLLPGKSHGQRSMVGYSPWGGKESDTTEWLHFTSLCYYRILSDNWDLLRCIFPYLVLLGRWCTLVLLLFWLDQKMLLLLDFTEFTLLFLGRVCFCFKET